MRVHELDSRRSSELVHLGESVHTMWMRSLPGTGYWYSTNWSSVGSPAHVTPYHVSGWSWS